METTGAESRRIFCKKAFAGAASLAFATGHAEELFTVRTKTLDTGEDMTAKRKFVPVMLTPYTNDLRIDFEGLEKLVDFYETAGAKGYFANCLSSEMYALTDEERLELVKRVVKRVGGKMPVVATGSFGDSIETRAEYTKRMSDTGVDAVILITSHFAERNEPDSTLLKNLEKYLVLTEDIPLGTYECPSPYKRILSPEVLKHLAATNRVVYHKDTTLDPEKIKVKLDLIRNSRLEFYDAHTPNTVESLRMGARGMSCIAGNFYPEIIAWMCKHIDDKDREHDIQWIQAEITQADAIISRGYSLSAKYFLQRRGLPIETNSRNPKASLTAAQKEAMDDLFRTWRGWRERLGI